jgi:hypothetical protein
MKICKCSQKIHNVSQLKNVKAVGLALYGNCPKCNEKIPCGDMWRRTSVEEFTQKDNRSHPTGSLKRKIQKIIENYSVKTT